MRWDLGSRFGALSGISLAFAVGCSDGGSSVGAHGTSAAGYGGHTSSAGSAGRTSASGGHGGSVSGGGNGANGGEAAAAGAGTAGTSGHSTGGSAGSENGTSGTANAPTTGGTGSGTSGAANTAGSATSTGGSAGSAAGGGTANAGGGEGGQAGEGGALETAQGGSSVGQGGATAAGGTGISGGGFGGSDVSNGGAGTSAGGTAGADSGGLGGTGASTGGAAGANNGGLGGTGASTGGAAGTNNGGVGGTGVSTGGAAGMGGSGGADGTTRACCHGGTQTLNGGVWGACQGAYISAESCNGEDDDCNGQVDELGSITCGVGACKTTVPACAGDGVNHCVPGTPAAGPDGCDGIDNDCDGAVDEDCNVCLHVAPTGDDTAAANANGATPFRNVQPALDFAAAHPNVATRVCVASGTACGATATFAGPAGADLTLHDGLELLGGYESTGWTRCTNSTTTLAPQTGAGVLFPASIANQTVLDGFTITRSSAATSSGVTVDGAQGALLSNLTITGGPTVTSSYGVNVIDGGNATVVHSTIDAALATQEMIAVRASGGTVAIEDACSTTPDATTGHCTAQCFTSGPKISVSYQPASGTTALPAQVHAVLLEDAPGSRIERSTVCATENQPGGEVTDVAGVEVRGDATGVVLRANTVQAGISNDVDGTNIKAAVELRDCGGASPRLSDNEHLELNPPYVDGQDFYGVRAAGDCHPVLDGNTSVGITSGNWTNYVGGTGVSCESLGGVPSRCVLEGNGIRVHFGVPLQRGTFLQPGGTGVMCADSCARIEENSITGVGDNVSVVSSQDFLSGTGVSIQGSAAVWVARNEIVGLDTVGTCSNYGTGLLNHGGTGHFENNVLIGVRNAKPCVVGAAQESAVGFWGYPGDADVTSNYIESSASLCGTASVVGAAGNVFRNNILVADGCGYAFQGSSSVFEHNVISPPNPSGQPNSQGYNGLTTADAIDAQTTTQADGTIIGTCAMTSDYHLVAGSICIDAGTPTGAPATDMDGDPRDASPDIGPDEY